MDTNNEALEELRKRLKAKLKARVGKAREDMNYSQPEVLEELKKYGLDRTQGSLSQIENGSRLPSAEMLYVIAKHLHTSTDFFLGLSNNPLSAEDIEEELAAAKGEGKINKVMRRMGKEKQQQVFQFAEYLLSQEPGVQKKPPAISPPPLTEDQRLEAAINIILNSVEEKYGIIARRDMERRIREELSGGDAAK